MLGFEITFWDYLTFLFLFLCLVAFLMAVVWVLGLPGRIAIARRHPEADAVNLMGWVGFMAIVPWIPFTLKSFGTGWTRSAKAAINCLPFPTMPI